MKDNKGPNPRFKALLETNLAGESEESQEPQEMVFSDFNEIRNFIAGHGRNEGDNKSLRLSEVAPPLMEGEVISLAEIIGKDVKLSLIHEFKGSESSDVVQFLEIKTIPLGHSLYFGATPHYLGQFIIDGDKRIQHGFGEVILTETKKLRGRN